MSSENFDVWLFAVDLVNYVFLKCNKLQTDAVVDSCPNFVCRSFTDMLKTAVQLLIEFVRQDANQEFAKFQEQYKLRPDTYLKHCRELKRERSSRGTDAEGFLNFSVHMAFLAHRFHSGGDRRAQVSAVFVISEDYQQSKMKPRMWEALNRVAEKIVFGTTFDVDKRQPGQQLLQHLVPYVDSFSSPELEAIEKPKEKATDGLMKTVRYNLSDSKDLLRSKPDSCEITLNTRRRLNRRTSRELGLKISLKPMPSLEESLESSMEELSISKTSRVKLVNEDGPLNSTAELEFTWKLGKLSNNSPKRSSIDRQIFRLSPISPRHVREFSPKLNTSFS